MFCLPPAEGDKFIKKIADGTIDPYKLSKMTSEQRHAFFEKHLGKENAKPVNSLFESKLLLKKQSYGFTTWARHVAGITPEVRRDLISRISRLDRVLNPAEEEQFLKDLASTKLGVDVTQAEAKKIALMSKKIEATKANMSADYTFKTEAERLTHGRAIVALTDYVDGLKLEAGKTGLRGLISRDAILSSPSKTAGLAKSLKATLDNSVLGRQGLKVLFTHPTVWLKNGKSTFTDMWKEWGGKDAMKEVRADVLSRQNALNGLYKKEKLAIGVIEEAFPTPLPGRVPGLGRVFKGSESAFEGFQFRSRADIFDKYVETAKKSGGDIQGIGKLANALTGRGHMGKLEPIAPTLNNLFFSPRLMKSNFDALTAHITDKNMSSFARKKAAENTLKIVLGAATVMAIADAVMPGSVEFDPRSADFGKIKIGDTRFDVTGGMSSIATLAARFATRSTKSSGVIKKLNQGGYGSQTVGDVLYSFFENKLSPAASVINDVAVRGADFQGNKPTAKGEIGNLFTPLPITTYVELKNDPNSAPKLAAMISDGLGISVNTYGRSQKNWSNNPTLRQAEFKQKVSPAQFKLANDRYNAWVNQYLAANDDRLQKLDPDLRDSVVKGAKEKIEAAVMKQGGYTYKRSKPSKQNAKVKKELLKSIQ